MPPEGPTRSSRAARPSPCAPDHWQDAFTALGDAALDVALDGRRLRVIDAPARRVASLLASAGIPAEAEDVPATMEEVFVELARRPAA